MRPNPIRAIAFDLDNTLIDRDAAFLKLIADWSTSFNGDKQLLIERIFALDKGGYSDRDTFFGELAEMAVFHGNGRNLRDRFYSQFPSYFTADPKILNLLVRLKNRGIELAILTNGGGEVQRAKLERAGLDGFFDQSKILVSGEIGCEKPSAKAFGLLSERLKAPVESTLFVGDHLENDIIGAKASGYQTCWVSSSTSIDEKIGLPFDFKISSLSDIEKICLT